MNASWDDGVSCTILWFTVTLTYDLVFRKFVSGEYLILLKVRIPNLVCGCNFWLRSVTYHFWVTLTSDLVYRIIVSWTYLLYCLRWESQIFRGAYHFGSLLPWHWLLASFLGFSCLEHSYITANFPRMCLMLDQFLWGHSSRDCDISCLWHALHPC